jgi:uncharacterized protein YsxB (DUF464 family)
VVEIELQRFPDGGVKKLVCSGHAGFGDEDGPDLVCAAVSALTGAIGIGLTDGRQGPFPVSAADGKFLLHWKKAPSECDAFLVLTVVKSLQQMEQHYPGFLRISEVR